MSFAESVHESKISITVESERASLMVLSVALQELQKLVKFYDPSQEEEEKQEKKKDEVRNCQTMS